MTTIAVGTAFPIRHLRRCANPHCSRYTRDGLCLACRQEAERKRRARRKAVGRRLCADCERVYLPLNAHANRRYCDACRTVRYDEAQERARARQKERRAICRQA